MYQGKLRQYYQGGCTYDQFLVFNVNVLMCMIFLCSIYSVPPFQRSHNSSFGDQKFSHEMAFYKMIRPMLDVMDRVFRKQTPEPVDKAKIDSSVECRYQLVWMRPSTADIEQRNLGNPAQAGTRQFFHNDYGGTMSDDVKKNSKKNLRDYLKYMDSDSTGMSSTSTTFDAMNHLAVPWSIFLCLEEKDSLWVGFVDEQDQIYGMLGFIMHTLVI